MLPLTELGHSRQGQQTKQRGSEMGKQPMCQGEGPKVYHFDMECSYLPRGTYIDFGGMAYALQSSQTETTEHEVMLFKRKGGYTYRPLGNTPHLTIYIDSCYTYCKLIVTVVHTKKLL